MWNKIINSWNYIQSYRGRINWFPQMNIASVGNSYRSASLRPTALEEDRELLLIFLQFYVNDLRFKAWGPRTFLTEFQTLNTTASARSTTWTSWSLRRTNPLGESTQGSSRKHVWYYRQVSNIRRTKSQHFKDSRTVLQLSLPNPLKPDVKSRMKM